jgi:hypothetical protein
MNRSQCCANQSMPWKKQLGSDKRPYAEMLAPNETHFSEKQKSVSKWASGDDRLTVFFKVNDRLTVVNGSCIIREAEKQWLSLSWNLW